MAFTKNGERLVGDAARRQAAVNVDRTFFSIKREMGSAFRAKIDGKQYTPQEISAMILRKLKRCGGISGNSFGCGDYRTGIFQ